MSFQYSSFISYRHNELEKKFFLNLKNVLAKEIFFVTNKAQAFYDIEAIDWGQRWDDKIYSGIGDSYFFLPVWYYHYLNENNLWCARELYHALEIEKIIRDQLDPADQKNFFFIFPLIYRGDTSLIPECLSKISAMPLNNLEIDIRNNKDTTRLTNFKRAMNNLLLKNFRILEKYKIDFQQLFSAIPRPTDDQIKEWIKAQKDFINKQEASRLPRITKNEE